MQKMTTCDEARQILVFLLLGRIPDQLVDAEIAVRTITESN